jgi:hypothetical protein
MCFKSLAQCKLDCDAKFVPSKCQNDAPGFNFSEFKIMLWELFSVLLFYVSSFEVMLLFFTQFPFL